MVIDSGAQCVFPQCCASGKLNGAQIGERLKVPYQATPGFMAGWFGGRAAPFAAEVDAARRAKRPGRGWPQLRPCHLSSSVAAQSCRVEAAGEASPPLPQTPLPIPGDAARPTNLRLILRIGSVSAASGSRVVDVLHCFAERH